MYLYHWRYTYPETVLFISNQCPSSALVVRLPLLWVFPDLTDPSTNPQENTTASLAWGVVEIGFFSSPINYFERYEHISMALFTNNKTRNRLRGSAWVSVPKKCRCDVMAAVDSLGD